VVVSSQAHAQPVSAVPERTGTSLSFKPGLIAFAITFLGAMVVALWLQGMKPFYYDSGTYWSLGKTFVRHGSFSLMNFYSPLRGYLLPLIYRGLNGIAVGLAWHASTVVKLFNVLVFSLIGSWLVPRLAEMTWPGHPWGLIRRLFLGALLMVFWSGYLNYPLSDFPALMMLMLALVALDRPLSPVWMLLSGAAAAAAVDMRPSYVLLVPVMVVLMVWGWLDRYDQVDRSRWGRVAASVALVVGLISISLPQSLSSQRHFRNWNPTPGTVAKLSNLQLTSGLVLQRYETYVGAGHPPEINFEDKTGQRLLDEQTGATISSFGQYLGLIFKHPVAMAGVFGRHVINGLDQRYSTPYVEHLSGGSNRFLRIAGFLLVFLALIRVIWPSSRRKLGAKRWRFPVALMVCCLTSVPSAIEPRYLLPVYLLSYMLALAPNWPSPLESAQPGVRRLRTLSALAVAYLAFMALVWHVVSGATGHMVFG
jgi:hypothetical protein